MLRLEPVLVDCRAETHSWVRARAASPVDLAPVVSCENCMRAHNVPFKVVCRRGAPARYDCSGDVIWQVGGGRYVRVLWLGGPVVLGRWRGSCVLRRKRSDTCVRGNRLDTCGDGYIHERVPHGGVCLRRKGGRQGRWRSRLRASQLGLELSYAGSQGIGFRTRNVLAPVCFGVPDTVVLVSATLRRLRCSPCTPGRCRRWA